MTYYTAGQIVQHRDEWVEALLSDKFSQTQKYLRVTEVFKSVPPQLGRSNLPVGHCCLGVMCELVPGLTIDDYSHTSTVNGVLYDSNDVDLPERAQDWFGVVAEDLYFDFPENLTIQVSDPGAKRQPLRMVSAAGLNDGGLTFKQIAQTFRYFGLTAQIDVLQGASREDHDQ